MSDIKWIKITTDIFDDEKIKLIEKLPEGDTMLVIWLKLLALAGKRNDLGMVYLTRDIPFTADTLADIMNRDSKVVMMALNTFVSFDMIEIVDDFIKIVNWEKHQNIEGMERTKELRALRNKRYYEKKKLIDDKSKIKTSYRRQQDTLDKIRLDKNKYRDNILLKETEYNTLIEKYGINNVNKILDKLSSYKLSNGKKYKSDYGAINNWVISSLGIKEETPDLIYKDQSAEVIDI